MKGSIRKRVPFNIWLAAQPREEDCDHLWHPIVQLGVISSQWNWQCARCTAKRASAPPGLATSISQKDLEAMVDSSLRLADVVLLDDQSVKGELWIMRHAHWAYKPFEFEVLYHVLEGVLCVMYFRYHQVLPPSPLWISIRETRDYKGILEEADNWRMHNG